jgi:hypothetical protein
VVLRGVIQMLDCLPVMLEALGLVLSTIKHKKQ